MDVFYVIQFQNSLAYISESDHLTASLFRAKKFDAYKTAVYYIEHKTVYIGMFKIEKIHQTK
tara:strand:+ start:454 stop:639 length:186 start_codon:yes stop_codon:yes gene_type:complete